LPVKNYVTFFSVDNSVTYLTEQIISENSGALFFESFYARQLFPLELFCKFDRKLNVNDSYFGKKVRRCTPINENFLWLFLPP